MTDEEKLIRKKERLARLSTEIKSIILTTNNREETPMETSEKLIEIIKILINKTSVSIPEDTIKNEEMLLSQGEFNVLLNQLCVMGLIERDKGNVCLVYAQEGSLAALALTAVKQIMKLEHTLMKERQYTAKQTTKINLVARQISPNLETGEGFIPPDVETYEDYGDMDKVNYCTPMGRTEDIFKQEEIDIDRSEK